MASMKHLAGHCTFGITAPLAAAGACAQTYPVKPVRFVVPFVAGGTPEQFGDYVKSEIAKFARVVKEAKITAQ